MAKSLVVVESPAKAKTINKYLGKEFIVKASMGHIRDLPENELGVDIKNGFKPKYVTIKGKSKVIKELRETAKQVDRIYLAADPDREGEAICWHLKQILDSAKKPIYRITFNEITERAIKEAIKNPGDIDLNLVNAQQARRILDRLVGYQISPMLWRSVKGGLSAGRVQSVALRLVCEREEERERFQPQEYWVINVELETESGERFQARLISIGDRKAEIEGKGFLIKEDEAKSIAESIRGLTFKVSSVKKQKRRQSPPPPFITSKLQQEANRKFRFTASKTMTIAQQLYEGVELGEEGPVGLVTYIRTDSTRIADEAVEAVRRYIETRYGGEYLPPKPNVFKNRRGAQDAHEAIRPTSVERTPESIKEYLSPDQYKLYSLIWKRFVACQMRPAEFELTSAEMKAGEFTLKATGSVVLFDGFMRVYTESKDEEEEERKKLPPLEEGQTLRVVKVEPQQSFTQPPPRYTEATLIKELEEKGIGRPSTYATIISTLFERGYVVKEKGRLVPTELGKLVNKLLIKSFPEIMDVKFTANMESKLDEIEEGRANWIDVLKEFYANFRRYLEAAPRAMSEAKKEMVEETDEVCKLCGRKMVIRWGRYGRFLACSAYPECKFTRPLGIGVKCPKCGGELVERRSKKGNTFYGCENYPDCDYVVWDKPVDKPCPKCGFPFLVEKRGQRGRRYLACPNEGCDHVER